MTAQCSNQFRSLCKTSCPSRESTAPPSFVSSANLIMVHSTPASRSLIKLLNRASPGVAPWGTPLVTSHQPDAAPFTATIWVLLFRQFFSQCAIYLLIPQLEHLSRGMLWATVSKALLKSRKLTSTACPSPTRQVTLSQKGIKLARQECTMKKIKVTQVDA